MISNIKYSTIIIVLIIISISNYGCGRYKELSNRIERINYKIRNIENDKIEIKKKLVSIQSKSYKLENTLKKFKKQVRILNSQSYRLERALKKFEKQMNILDSQYTKTFHRVKDQIDILNKIVEYKDKGSGVNSWSSSGVDIDFKRLNRR